MERCPVTIYTDGACKGNPGPGGWAAILEFGTRRRELVGYEYPTTTNNRMELTAVIEGVRACKRPCDITIVTDSTYVMMSQKKWEVFMAKKEKKNADLWMELIRVCRAGNHKLRYRKVEGHTGHTENELCDTLAKEQSRRAEFMAVVSGEVPA